MIVHRLSAEGFGILGDPVTIFFPPNCRLAILGGNETGKTTLLEAIEYALYGLRRGPSAEEQRENIVTWGKDEARLEIEFTAGNERYLLERVIGAKTGHKARLRHLDDPHPQTTPLIVTSLREIELKIAQLTGMDRESFTKLVYVKQKDLDALRDLARSQRERLINKVMGIEVFDTAEEKVKADLKKIHEALTEKDMRLESTLKNKRIYEEKKKLEKELEDSVSTLRLSLEGVKGKLKDSNQLLDAYEWLSAKASVEEVLNSLRAQLKEAQNKLEEVTVLTEHVKTLEESLTKYRPEVERLEKLKVKFTGLEGRMEEAEEEVKALARRLEEAVQRTGVTREELGHLSKGLPERKRRFLLGFGAASLASVILMTFGFLSNIAFGAAGLAILPLALLLFNNYLKTDRLLTRSGDILSLQRQRDERGSKILELKAELDELAEEGEFTSSKEVDDALHALLNEVYAATRNRSIQGVEAVIIRERERLRRLEGAHPSQKVESIHAQISEKEEEAARLRKKTPPRVEELTYTRSRHEELKEAVATLQAESSRLEGEVQNKLGVLDQLGRDLEALQPDYDLYPILEREVKDLESERRVRERLLQEFSETSRELRNKVIPHARFIINRILPVLTDGRYADFEITEDLKFKAHSLEAGGYKEREVFSGGTQDQFLIALRLAFTQSILDSRVTADQYSLLMDECISSSDEARKQGIFEVLEAMRETFSQIFIIAHEDVTQHVDHHIVLERNRRGYTEVRSKSW